MQKHAFIFQFDYNSMIDFLEKFELNRNENTSLNLSIN